MIIELLVLHRKESYEGEYGPEVIAVADEAVLEENPDWWILEQERQRSLIGDQAAAWTVVRAEVDPEHLMEALYPEKYMVTLTMAEEGSHGIPIF